MLTITSVSASFMSQVLPAQFYLGLAGLASDGKWLGKGTLKVQS